MSNKGQLSGVVRSAFLGTSLIHNFNLTKAIQKSSGAGNELKLALLHADSNSLETANLVFEKP
jgi:hypothetical protein